MTGFTQVFKLNEYTTVVNGYERCIVDYDENDCTENNNEEK
jgi:hypothetical protein